MPGKPSPRAVFAIAVALSVASFLFVATYAFTQHDPKPTGLRVAFVGPAVTQKALQVGLDHGLPGAIDVRTYSSAATARRAVLDRSVYGAYVVNPPQIMVASAAGPAAAQFIETALLKTLSTPVMPTDLRPLPAGDSHGLTSSALQSGLLLPSFVFGMLLFIFGAGVSLRRRLAATAAFVLVASLLAALTVGPIIGALPGHFWALFAIGALFAAAAALTTYGLESVFGFAGTAIAALTLVLLGNATAGGAMNQEFLPNGFRQISQALPNGAAVRAIRNTVYFQAHHTGQALLVVTAWALGGLLLILASGPFHNRLGRREKALGSL